MERNRLAGARSRLEREWQRLSGGEREALPSPDALAGEDGAAA